MDLLNVITQQKTIHMTIFNVILILYTVATILGIIKFEHLRYRLLFGYVAGIALGSISLLIVDFDLAVIIGVFTGLASTVKMMMSPNR